MTTIKGSHWSITINNPTEADHQIISQLPMNKFVKLWKGQLEKGENGTEHIQGMLQTEYIRFSAIKKLFPRAHIEKAKNVLALSNYVEKEDTRIGTIETYKAFTCSDIYEECCVFDTYDELIEDYVKYQNKKWLKWVEDGSKGKVDDNYALDTLDTAVANLIKKGAQIEFMASNPSFRTAFKTYFSAIMFRQYNSETPADKCGQTDKINSNPPVEE